MQLKSDFFCNTIWETRYCLARRFTLNDCYNRNGRVFPLCNGCSSFDVNFSVVLDFADTLLKVSVALHFVSSTSALNAFSMLSFCTVPIYLNSFLIYSLWIVDIFFFANLFFIYWSPIEQRLSHFCDKSTKNSNIKTPGKSLTAQLFQTSSFLQKKILIPIVTLNVRNRRRF